MGRPGVAEYPPLFALGFHSLSREEIRKQCVDAFPSSTTRAAIFAGLEIVIDFLTSADVTGTLWIDGSFTTEKINPNDADVILACDGTFFNDAPPHTQAAVREFIAGFQKNLHCHTFVHFAYPLDHELYIESHFQYCFYVGKMGWTSTHEPKGIVTLDIAGDAS